MRFAASDVLAKAPSERRRSQGKQPIDAGLRIGHIHLKVTDPDRALSFYRGVLGFELMQRYGLFKATTELHGRLEGTQIDCHPPALLQSTGIQMPPRHALEQPR